MNAHVARLERHAELGRLGDRRLLRELAYVNGKWTAGAGRGSFEVRDPASGAGLAWVASLAAEDAGDAVAAASQAFPLWRALLPQERAAKLRAWFDLIVAAKDDLALLITLEQGKPLAEAAGEVEYAASFVAWYAEEATRVGAESVTSHLADAQMLIRRDALGVVGVVTPWNFPSAMLTRKAAAALAAGCTVVAHPSSWTPLSALALAELADRAGLPAGVFNVVTGDAETIVGRLCEDVRVRAMSFTGSTEIGRLIAAQCAPTMKRLVMELGGHAPLIVFPDADLDKAVEIAMAAKFATSGQDCLAANRIFVHADIYEAFAHRFAKRARALKVGGGLEEDVAIGPLMHAGAVAKCQAHVDDALAHGARLLAGGRLHEREGLFYAPTVIADADERMAIFREETFGPVAAIARFSTEAEAIARANDTEYGLVAYLVTRDAARIMRMGRALEYGMVAVNRVKITGAPIPFGGVKQSGLGREGSRQGLEAFTELKYLCLDAA